jgi:signal transduction histidine kinase
MTIFQRSLLGFFLILLVTLAIAAPLTAWTAERIYIKIQSDNLMAQAKLTARSLPSDSIPPTPELYLQSSNAQPGMHVRQIDALHPAILRLSPPLGNSPPLPETYWSAENPVSPEEVLARPEVQQALAGIPSTYVRSVSGGVQVLYAAAPVWTPGGGIHSIVYMAEPVASDWWRAIPEDAQGILMAGVIAAGLLTVGVAWWQARSLARPIRLLADTTAAIEKGDWSRRAPEASTIREIQSLAHALNTMTAALERSDRSKTALMADVNHELRTPLTIIKGSLETLREGAWREPAARKKFLASTEKETERLIRLVNDLLVLARADSGAMLPKKNPVNLTQLARQRSALMSKPALRRGVRFVVREVGEEECCVCLGTEEKLAQILDNILENAKRHASRGTEVAIALRALDGGVECSVTDSGPGIPARHIPFLFDRFYRAESSRNRASGGTGLGLAICKALVEAHGGSIRIESVEGRGTTVTFWIPGPSPVQHGNLSLIS